MNSWDHKLVIVLPAYNESENLHILLRKIRKVVAHSRIIIVDDSTPPENAKEIEQNYPHVTVMTRKKKLGRGSAVLDGFAYALKDKSLEYFIEMDTDLSHDPLQIPRLKEALLKNKAHLVVGSRYLEGSKIIKWPLKRIILSKIINYNLSLWLGVKLHDFTNGYRLYTRDAVSELVKVGLRQRGFIALSESVYILHKKGLRIIEAPITFVDRIHGTSSVGVGELYASLVGAFVIKFRNASPKRNKKRSK